MTGFFSVVRYLGKPLLLGIVCLSLYLYVSSQELGSIEQSALNSTFLWEKFTEHIRLTAVSTMLVLTIAVPGGVLLTRPATRRITSPVLALATLGQAIPSIGLLVLFAIVLGVGFNTVIYALVAYSTLPVLRNTMVGLEQVDRSSIEAGRGMGMTNTQVLLRIELPLAIPVILAGLRTALVLNVGTATLATFVDAGGLGTLIDNGISTGRTLVLLTGSILTAVLALLIDWIGGVVEDLLKPKALKKPA